MEIENGIGKNVRSPCYCEVWYSSTYEREFLILGNSTQEDGSIWAFDLDHQEMCYMPIKDTKYVRKFGFDETNMLCIERAKKGCADSMWWLAWINEGTNHPKSVWFYIAALRANPDKHSWAFKRIYADSRSSYMCEGVEEPCLEFLGEIEDFQTGSIGDDWKAAIDKALTAVHKPKV